MFKPFIYPFEYIGSYFFYDVNKNQIVEVSQALYDVIINEGQQKSGLENSCNMLEDMISGGFLSSNKAELVEHPLECYIEDYLCGSLKGMILQLTQNCNLKCRYCIYAGDTNLSRGHNKKNMTWETAKKTIDFFAQNSKYSKEVEIGFYGGEPMLVFDLLKLCVDYCNKKLFDKKIVYKVTTNGTVFSEDMLRFLKNNDVDITISIDGPAEIHNMNRRFAYDGKGSYTKITQNLLKIKDFDSEYYQNKIQFNSVVAEQDKWNETLDFFRNNPLFSNNAVFLNNVSDNYLKESYQDMEGQRINSEKIKFEILMAKILGKQSKYYGNISEELERLKNLFAPMEPLSKKVHHLGPCMPGYRRLFVDIYGTFRVCEKCSEISPHMIIGNTETGFSMEAVSKLLNIGKLTEEECLTCPIIRNCKICAVAIDSVDKLSVEKKRRLCSVCYRTAKSAINH